LDFTGFAKKFGPVLSYVRLADEPAALNQVRIDKARADALIGCDLVVSSSPKASATYRAGHTRAVVNSAEMSTADFVRFRDANLKGNERIEAIRRAVGELSSVAATKLAERLLGNTIYSNVLMLGFAWQHGLVPVSMDAILRAIELNGVEIDNNRHAFGWGRIAAADPAFVRSRLDQPESRQPESLDSLVERRAAFLVDYQDQALSDRYLELVERVRRAEQRLTSRDLHLTEAVARAYFKTLAYKDEYEVARLHVDTGFLERIRKEYGGQAKVKFHLAPPIMNRGRDARGRPLKREFGPWMIPLFRVLARLRRLRGTPLDVFGLTAERRLERRLIEEFEQTVDALLASLSLQTVDEAIAIVNLYLEIRGYGPVKDEAAAKVRAEIASRLAEYAAGRREAACSGSFGKLRLSSHVTPPPAAELLGAVSRAYWTTSSAVAADPGRQVLCHGDRR
ncbi:MAG TPA: DUF6537 domain-containing protein, partial [Woeseiaceae bacterium]|nr:DUF6537 domain-containing protein [Woeseiaceae bacterium]